MERRNQSRISIAVAVSLLLMPSSASAVMGVGDLVSDPGAYTYYAEQVEAAYNQLEKLKEQYDTMEKTYENAQQQLREIQRVKDSLDGAYNYASSTVTRLKHIEKMPEEFLSPMAKQVEKTGDAIFNNSGKEVTWEQLQKDLDRTYGLRAGDPKHGIKDKWIPTSGNNDKWKYQQGSHYANLMGAENELAKLKARNERVSELSKKANSAKTAAEKQAVTNALLAEMLAGQNEMIMLIANMARAQSAERYKRRTRSETAVNGTGQAEVRDLVQEYGTDSTNFNNNLGGSNHE